MHADRQTDRHTHTSQYPAPSAGTDRVVIGTVGKQVSKPGEMNNADGDNKDDT